MFMMLFVWVSAEECNAIAISLTLIISTNIYLISTGLTRVEHMKILGVTFSSSFTFDKHVDIICSRARQAQYAIRVLASHGLRGQRLHDVVRSTLVAGLTYSSPSWWGFAGAADRVRLQAVLTRIGRLGYLPEDTPSIEQICSKADKALFASVCHNPEHVLSHLLPPKKESVHALRPRVHDRVLPEADDRMRRTFLTRMLYSDYSCLWTYNYYLVCIV